MSDYFSFQAKRLKVDQAVKPTEKPREVRVDELTAKPSPIEVEETTVSDTFIGRLKADIRKLWGGKE